MGLLAETALDLTDAFEDLRSAGGAEPQHRRALRAVLDDLYRVREFRQGRPVGNTKEHRTAYAQRVDACDAGKVTQGVIFLRGVLTHHLLKQVEPVPTPLYPPLYPGPDTFPGANFTWLTTDDLLAVHPEVPKQQVAQFEYYRSHVAGQMMLPTLRRAINFLLNDPVIIKLEYV